MANRKRLPRLCRHKASGQGYVTDPRVGREVYLGPYGSPGTVEAYNRWCRDYLAGKPPPGPGAAAPGCLLLADLAERYLAWARSYYRKAGAETSEVRTVLMAVRAVLAVCPEGTPAGDFGPTAFRRARDHLAARLSRKSVNAVLGRVRGMFRWAVAEELLPPAAWQALLAVRGLGKGRGGRERPPVAPVPWGVVDATLPRLAGAQRAAVLLGWHGAMRPGEVVRMVAGEVDRSREPWLYLPGSWKTEHHEGLRRREVFLGPKAREVLRPWLDACAGPAAFVFPGRQRGRHLSGHTVADSVRLACLEEPAIPHWSPNALRHAQATAIRKKFSIEAVQAVLGHANADMAEVYAEKDRELAARVIEELG